MGTSAGCSTAATASDGFVWLRKVLIQQLDDFLHVGFILAFDVHFDDLDHTVIFLVLQKKFQLSGYELKIKNKLTLNVSIRPA